LTKGTSNVFYEAGLAHVLGRAVVLISQSDEDVPFDLRHRRYIRYNNSKKGREALSADLTSRLKTLRRAYLDNAT
jgi:hypothetical protein